MNETPSNIHTETFSICHSQGLHLSLLELDYDKLLNVSVGIFALDLGQMHRAWNETMRGMSTKILSLA